MNTKIKFTLIKIILLLQLFFLSDAKLISQESSIICGDNIINSNIPRYPVGSSDVLRALLIYVRYEDDYFNCCDGWPVNRWDVPVWYDQMLTPENQTITNNPSISGYFDAMSMNGWQIRGEEYSTLYITDNPASYYNNNNLYLGGVVEEMLNDFDQNIDFSLYDRYDPEDLDSDQNIYEPDGYVDMLIVWFRWLKTTEVEPSGYYSGVAALGGVHFAFPNGLFTTNDVISAFGQLTYVKLDPGAIKSGLLGEGTSPNSINLFVHEVGHYQVSNHTPHLGLWNLMTGNGVGIMNTYERSQTALSWIPASTEITSTGTYNLSDFETTGESFKIPLQNSQFYVLENRGDNGFYSTKGNWLMPENGLLVTKNNNSGIFCADHKWSWETTSGSCNYCSGSAYIYPFNQIQPSNSGLFDMNLFNVCTYNSSSYACRSHDSSYGDAGDIWAIGYNQVFSPWSNPQTENATNGNQVVIDVLQKNQDGSLDIFIKYGVTNGEVDTHPAKPLLYRPVIIANCYGTYGYPRITWDNNSEPDMVRDNGSARYYIYRAFSTNAGETFSQYSYIATYNDFSPTDTANFIDNDFFTGVRLWCSELIPPPEEYNVYYRYKIIAVDKEEYQSVMSDFVTAKGRSNVEDQFKNVNTGKPTIFSLNQNYPNPFNPSTQIKYSLPVNGLVKITIYDIIGREVFVPVNEFKEAGFYSIIFDGTNLPSGVYIYQIVAGNYIDTKKMVLLK